MSESESQRKPSFELEVDGNIYEATRDNTTLYTFFGELATRDQILYVQNKEDGNRTIAAVTRNDEHFREYVNKMLAGKFEAHLNLPEVPETCEYVYQRIAEHREEVNQFVEEEMKDIPDEFRLEDWQ